MTKTARQFNTYGVVHFSMTLPLEITSPVIFGKPITFDELSRVFDGVLQRINENQNAIWLGMHITNVNVQDWHRDNSRRFSGLTSKEVKFSESERRDVEEFVNKRERTSLAEKSMVMLGILIERLHGSASDIQLEQEVRKRLNVRLLQEIRGNLHYFIDKATVKKAEWWFRFLHEGDVWRIPGEEVQQWVIELANIRGKINELITEQQACLVWDQRSCEMLFDRLRTPVHI